MPYLNEIITEIDRHLSAGPLKYERFKAGYFAGLTQQIPVRKAGDVEKLFVIPAVVTNLGEFTQVVPDDNYNIITYHRILTNQYGVAEQRRQYGDGNKYMAATTDVLYNVIAFTNKLLLSTDEIEALIMSDFPDALSATFLATIEMRQVIIQPTLSRFDSVALFSEEYRGETYFLKPESVLFQIRYRIEAVFKKGCFTICDDC